MAFPCDVKVLALSDAGVARIEWADRWMPVVRAIFPLTPRAIIEYLKLRRPIYKKTAAYGHFGRSEPEFTWEQTNKGGELKSHFKR